MQANYFFQPYSVMPKKFVGENSKAVAAKARKAAVEEEKAQTKKKQIEDEYWKDDDKNLAKKQARKVSLFIYFNTEIAYLQQQFYTCRDF